MICHGKAVPYRHLVEKTQTARWDKKSNALFKKIIGRKMLETRFLAMWQTGVTTNRMFLILIHFSTSLKNTHKYHKPKHRRLLFKVTIATVTTCHVSSQRPSTSAMLQRFCYHPVSTRSVYLPRPLGGNFLYLHFFVFSLRNLAL